MGGGYALRASRQVQLTTEKKSRPRNLDPPAGALNGVLTTNSNPFWYACGSLWQRLSIDAKTMGMQPVNAFYLGHVSVDFCGTACFPPSSAAGGKKFSNRVYNIPYGSVCSYLTIWVCSF
jgi:hypothetical protein